MQQKKILTHQLGVDVSEYRVVELSRENLISVGFEKCPQRFRHFYLHAVQHQQPIPSLQSMERTEKRNKNKVLASKGYSSSQQNQVIQHQQAKRRIKGSKKRLPPTSLPPSVITKPANALKTFIVRSPEWLALKAARMACEAQAEVWFAKEEGESESISNPVSSSSVKKEKHLPVYFKKKHRSHKRRIKERRALIQANSKKLVEMYGGDILRKDCRISTREVKVALGLVEKTEMDVEGVGEFMAMVDQNDESSSSSESSQSHN